MAATCNPFPSQETVRRVREAYPSGCRVELVSMNDPYNTRLKPGALGTVERVDDIATVFVAWDCGSRLGAAFDEDVIRRLEAESKNVTSDGGRI